MKTTGDAKRQPAIRPEFLLIPAAFFATACVVRGLLRSAPAGLRTDLWQPLPVVTAWHDFGLMLWCCAFAGIIVASIAYLRLLGHLMATAMQPPRIILLCALSSIASVAAALFFPVVFSSDVYAYAAYGALAAHGLDPYAHARIMIHDPLITAAIWQWSNPLPVCAYGPAFVWIAKTVIVMAAPLGMAAQLFSMRLISSAALLLCAPLVAALFEDRRRRAVAAAGLVLNPVAIWCAAEGHNDTLVLACVLLGLVTLRRFGYAAGALILTASALIKASGALAAVALAAFAWPQRRRFGYTCVGIAAGCALVAILARPQEAGIATALIPHGHYTPQFSLQYLVAAGATALFGQHVHAIEFALAIALVAAGALAYRGARLAIAGNLEGAGFLALALWLIIPNPYPWYALWILPVAFLAPGRRLSWAIVAASLTIFARYLPDMSAASDFSLNIAVTLFAIGAPWLIARTQLKSAVVPIAARSARYIR